jgi:hypothetical protein
MREPSCIAIPSPGVLTRACMALEEALGRRAGSGLRGLVGGGVSGYESEGVMMGRRDLL